jgi:hypothetical protein
MVNSIKKHRRIIGLLLLIPSLYLSYLGLANFEIVKVWRFELIGFNLDSVEGARHPLHWLGFISLFGLSACIGIILNKNTSKE